MSISYNSIVGFKGKVTLPSVESWGDNMQILRDPPKSIQTRKIDKVGETSDIAQMIQESGDRVNENILVYARGINPMVAVDFSNMGTNGGQYKGGQYTQGSRNSLKAFLPYRVVQDGYFRSALPDQRQELPLSRQPRVWTSAFSSPGFTDFSKSAIYENKAGTARSIKSAETILKKCIQPTAVYKIEAPISEGYEHMEVKHVIQNPFHVNVFSGHSSQKKINGEFGVPVKEIQENMTRPDIQVSTRGMDRNIDLSQFNTEKYTHDISYTDVGSNPSQNIQTTSIEDIYGVNPENNIRQDVTYLDVSAPTSYYEKNDLNRDVDMNKEIRQYEMESKQAKNIHVSMDHVSEREYKRVLPMFSARTNYGGDMEIEKQDMVYNLRPKISAGFMEEVPTIPNYNREEVVYDTNNSKNQMRGRVYNMQQDRNDVMNTTHTNPYMTYSPQSVVV